MIKCSLEYAVCLLCVFCAGSGFAAPVSATWMAAKFEADCVDLLPDDSERRFARRVLLTSKEAALPFFPVMGWVHKEPRFEAQFFDLYAVPHSRALMLNCALSAEVDSAAALKAAFARNRKYVAASLPNLVLPLPDFGQTETYITNAHGGTMGVIVFTHGTDAVLLSIWEGASR
ncbi:MAG: hypothetical protein AAF755_05465 [Pseudomonadota bacterium]